MSSSETDSKGRKKSRRGGSILKNLYTISLGEIPAELEEKPKESTDGNKKQRKITGSAKTSGSSTDGSKTKSSKIVDKVESKTKPMKTPDTSKPTKSNPIWSKPSPSPSSNSKSQSSIGIKKTKSVEDDIDADDEGGDDTDANEDSGKEKKQVSIKERTSDKLDTVLDRFNRDITYKFQEDETVGQKRHRLQRIKEGMDSAVDIAHVMDYEKKAIIKTAVQRARRLERVTRNITRNWDSSSESEECVDCYADKSIRRLQFSMPSSYRRGIKRTSLFATVIKWLAVLIGFYDYFATFYILFHIHAHQMWRTYFKAKQYSNCTESIIEPYQIEVLYYCLNMVNSVNLFFSLRRTQWRYLSYWLKTQVWIAVFSPIPLICSIRFNIKRGNISSLIAAHVLFHILLALKFGIVLYRYYMVKKPFYQRRLQWFTQFEKDRQLNQDLDSRLSSFIQKKNAYRNAFNAALYSVIKTLVDAFEDSGAVLKSDELHELIQKYDETLNDITMYPGIEQYLRMAYVRYCIKRGKQDKRELADQAKFFKLRDEQLRQKAHQKIMEEKRRRRYVEAKSELFEPRERENETFLDG